MELNSKDYGITVQGNHFLHSKLLNPAHKNKKNGSALRGNSRDIQPSTAEYLKTISQNNQGDITMHHSLDETVNNNGNMNVNNSYLMNDSYDTKRRGSDIDEVGDLINVQKMEIGYPDLQAPVNYDKKKGKKKF